MAGVRRNRAYRFRAYPDASQRELFAKTFGCVRFVYNRMLSDKIGYYEQTGRSKVFTPARYKSEFEWLKEVDSLALANAQLNLQRAYRSFFREKSAGYPKFKSRKNPMQSYTTNNVNGSIRVEGTGIRLPKAGAVRVKMHRQIPPGHEIKGATVTREATGKYYISVLTEYIAEEPSIETDVSRSIGLDYSSGHSIWTVSETVPTCPHITERQRRDSQMLSEGFRRW